MKKFLLGATVALAMAAPGLAHADDAGQVGAHYSGLDTSGPSIDVYGLDFAYAHTTSGGLIVQADASSDRIDASGSNYGIGYAAVNLGVRNQNSSFYGYLGHTDLVFAGDAFNVGIGGQLYFSSATLNGSVGYGDYDWGGVTNVNVDGTWFFSDNFGVYGQAAYNDFDGNYTVTTYGVGVDWRFDNSPIALNLGYQKADDDADVDTWRIGFTWNFGTDTLRQQSQSGASWDGARRQYQDVIYGL